MLSRKVLAVILAGGQGNRLGILSDKRAKPAVPFAGKYRIIDFTLSNCVNSGLYNVAILTQYRPRSLNDHIGIGRPWDLDRMEGGIRLLQPYLGRHDEDWYKGTADAVYQNLSFIEDQRVKYVLILSGDHVYKMNYEQMLSFHESKGADLTVAVMEVPWEEASRYGTLVLGEEDRVVEFDEKPKAPKSNLVSMGIYVFNKDLLMERLNEDARRVSAHDFGKDILPSSVSQDKVYGFRFQGYWRDVGTIKSYWEANMDLLGELPEMDLYERDLAIHTKPEDRPPVKTGYNAKTIKSLVCDGCIINGIVVHSVLSPGVYVEEGAVVRDSIVMNDTRIERDAVVNKAILDKNILVGTKAHIGFGDDFTPNRRYPKCLFDGITVVGKNSRIPPEVQIGRNCIIGSNITEDDFRTDFIASGLVLNRY
ncbi:MAG: glucose-1-phosphate adenylyltransferase [Chloroflexi bacterium]|nr:glucose-1-phosphate adenylyltransferase [Chloroflexota bacterium]MDA8186599.1 glucose-1-phosphate adenylyltransferase [Dehalococcoidales bacterium]